MISESTISIVKEIAPAVAANAETITRKFYELMFAENPETKAFFNPAHQHSGGQQKALAGAIVAYFSNIDNLSVLGPAVELIAQKHCSLGVQPEHYPIVGKHLLAAIGEVMGDAVTEEIVEAVSEAYGVLSKICIDREVEIYQSQIESSGGWNGYRSFRVSRRQPESENIVSFYLEPADEGELPWYSPGQYVTVRLKCGEQGSCLRNYSLSDAPGKPFLRISVKKESGGDSDVPSGVVSTQLHNNIREGDTIELGPPCGEFTLSKCCGGERRPVVLLAGGIGVTPLLSMAKHLAKTEPSTPLFFLSAAKSSRLHAFESEIEQLDSIAEQVETVTIFDEPMDSDLANGKCDKVGYVTSDLIREWTLHQEAEFYFCGPKPFMQNVYSILTELNVPTERIHFEFFGPRQEITASPVLS